MSDGIRSLLMVLSIFFAFLIIAIGGIILTIRGTSTKRKYAFIAIGSGICFAVFLALSFGFNVFVVSLGFLVGAGIGSFLMFLGDLRRRFNRWIIGEPDPQLKWLYTPRSSAAPQEITQSSNESMPMRSRESLRQEEQPVKHQSPFPTPPAIYSMEPLPSARNFDQAEADREALDR